MLRRIHSVPADYLAAQLAWAETDPKAIAFRLAKKQVADETALQHIANVDEAKQKRIDEGNKKRQLVEDLKMHGGPMTSVDELKELKERFADNPEKLMELVSWELRYHRDIINDTSRDQKFFRAPEKANT